MLCGAVRHRMLVESEHALLLIRLRHHLQQRCQHGLEHNVLSPRRRLAKLRYGNGLIRSGRQ